MGVVAVGEAADEFIRLCETAGLLDLLVRRVRIAPAEVLADRAGEELVLLQHHGDRAAQRLDVIVAHVDAADLHAALRRVVQAWDQLHERRFADAGAADDAHGAAGGDMQVHVLEGILLCALAVLEAHVRELDGAVPDFGDGLVLHLEARLLDEHLDDTLHGLIGDGHHHIDHGDHHEAHEDLHAVGEHGGDLADVDKRAAARDNELRADHQHENHVEVHAQRHERVVERHDTFGFGEVLGDAAGGLAELLLLVVLAGEALHHAHRAHVFLNGLVHPVIAPEDRAEGRHGLAGDQQQTHDQHRHDHQEGRREAAAHAVGHDDGEHEHQRCAHRDTDRHHEGHLHIGDVRREAGHERGGGELVNVLKGEVLDALKHVVPDVFCKAGRGLGAGVARAAAAQK